MKKVRYIGTAVPSLTGRDGYVVRTDRKGWVHVKFYGEPAPVKCAAVHLEDEWQYRGDVNVEHGGLWINDAGDEDYVRAVELVACSEAGGPDNLFHVTIGSIYLPTDEARRKAALDTVGWYEESMSDREKRMCLIDGFRAYHGIDADAMGGEVVIQVGPKDKDFWDGKGWNPAPDHRLRSNVNLRKWVEDNLL